MNTIFVFGSNLKGIHGAGSAREACEHWGARWGVGEGRTGNAYAIPTKNESLRTLPLANINVSVKKFLKYAGEHPELQFIVVRIGCGLAGYKEEQIKPFFRDAPSNCHLPAGWRLHD
jgi:hypothetical protein